MKKLILGFLIILSVNTFAQQKGISYQAVILNPNDVKVPGYNVSGTPLENTNICMSFQILNSNSQVEYEESQTVSTDQFGMVNLVIGTGTKTGGSASNIESIPWNNGAKTLVVSINIKGDCSNYTEISRQVLNYVPYAIYAEDANIKDGVITTAKLSDGAVTDVKIASSISASKVGLGNVDNTSDADKPISTATQIALNLKEDITNKSSDSNLGTSNTLYPTQNAVKSYIDNKIQTSTIADADANTKGKIRLAGDLSGTADAPTIPALANKEDISNKSSDINLADTASNKFPTVKAVKSYVDVKIASATIADADANTKGKIRLAGDLSGTADAPTIPALANKEDISNKSSDINLADTASNKFPTVKAVKSYVDTKVNSYAQNMVDLTTNQVINGIKTFNANATFNGNQVGKGNASGDGNLAVGQGALNSTSTGQRNTALGWGTLAKYVGTSFDNNTSVGFNNMSSLTTGSGNTSVGAESMLGLLTGISNTSIGNQSLISTLGNNNIGVGKSSGSSITNGNNNTIIGTEANVASGSQNNSIAIGYGAVVSSDNTIQLGNSDITDVKTSGKIITGEITYPNTKGNPGDVLTLDNSGIAFWGSGSALVDGKENAVNKSTDGTLSTNSDILYPSEKAVKTYVDANNGVLLNSINNLKTTHNADLTTTNNALNGKEDVSNKSVDIITDANSESKYPSVKAIKNYVDNQILNSATADADGSTKGIVKLAGDLGGTADLPSVPGLTLKANLESPVFTGTPFLPTGTTGVTQPTDDNSKALATTEFVKSVNLTNANLQGPITSVGNTTSIASQTGTGSTFVMNNSPTLITPNLGTPTYLDATNVTGLPLSSAVSGVLPVTNGGSGTTSLTGYLLGNGSSAFTSVSSIPVSDVSGAVKSVNGVTPINGNVSISFGNVSTGKLVDIPATGSNGDIYVVSGDSDNTINGNTYIFDGNVWQQVTANLSSTDARYVKLAGSTMLGNIDFPSGTKITMADTPSSSSDLTNKLYVDSQIANATPQASPTSKGILKLAGDLGGTGSTADAPVITDNAITSNKIADGAVTSSKLDNSGVTAATYGSNTSVPVITVDAKGRITSVSTTNIAATLTEVSEEFLTPTAGQINFTINQTPAGNTKVKMFINGVLIKDSAHTLAGKVITYNPSNNGNYTISTNDEIVFYYFY